MTEGSTKPKSDLGVRTASGVVMMSIAITAIWLGGYVFMAMVVLVGFGVFYEFVKLVMGFVPSTLGQLVWTLGGLIYVGVACFALLLLSSPFFGMHPAIMLIAGVIGTDVGAYFAGRTVGGPKIAPQISPSKTWSGLFGGMAGAGLMMNAVNHLAAWWNYDPEAPPDQQAYAILAYDTWELFSMGVAVAVIAQAGDFFESGMKRRAGVKDSGRLIPGHGGLFDRTDGLIAVSFAAGIYTVVATMMKG